MSGDSPMHPASWLRQPVGSLLDVGCNAGEWLGDLRRRDPSARLAGIDLNEVALGRARGYLPDVEFHRAGGEAIPFPDGAFRHVTCIEVIEHMPPEVRTQAFREFHRVLEPGGRLILTVPHAGWFAWLDSNNVRFRLPSVYGRLLGRGHRDASYAALGRHVEWHHHFTEEELRGLIGGGWTCRAVRHAGLFLYPLMDWFCWPFYRWGASDHWLRRFFERVAGWDYRFDFGRASYGILMVLEKTG